MCVKPTAYSSSVRPKRKPGLERNIYALKLSFVSYLLVFNFLLLLMAHHNNDIMTLYSQFNMLWYHVWFLVFVFVFVLNANVIDIKIS